MLIMRSIGATHRVWSNEAARRCAEIEAAKGTFNEVISIVAGDKARQMYKDGDVTAGVVSCGQGVGLSYDVPTMAELFDRIMEEAEATVKGLAS